jgi:hypothetical protein
VSYTGSKSLREWRLQSAILSITAIIVIAPLLLADWLIIATALNTANKRWPDIYTVIWLFGASALAFFNMSVGAWLAFRPRPSVISGMSIAAIVIFATCPVFWA